MTTIHSLIEETKFITNISSLDKNIMLKNEAIDRLDSIISSLPKYKKHLAELIVNFTIDDLFYLMNIIYRDNEFKSSIYYRVYNEYFDEIEDLVYKSIS